MSRVIKVKERGPQGPPGADGADGADGAGGNFTPTFSALASILIDDETFDRHFVSVTNGFGATITLTATPAIGTTIQFYRSIANAVNFVASGVTVLAKGGGSSINAQYGVVTAYKYSSTQWILYGDI